MAPYCLMRSQPLSSPAMNILLLALQAVLAAPMCPGCVLPVVAGGLAGMTGGSKAVAVGIARGVVLGSIVVPFGWVIADSGRAKNISWVHPNEMDVYRVHSTNEIVTENWGLAATFKHRTTHVYLLNDNLKQAWPESLVTMREDEFLNDLHREGILQVPTTSQGRAQWTVPRVPAGTYRLHYESGWSVLNMEAEFVGVSPAFRIEA